jgi:hypothetical protein
MLGALLLHETDLLSALAGKTLADKVSEPPTVKVVNALFKETLFTGVGSGEELSQLTIEQTITATIDIVPIILPKVFIITPIYVALARNISYAIIMRQRLLLIGVCYQLVAFSI